MQLKNLIGKNYFLYRAYYLLRFVLPYYILGAKRWDTFCIKRNYKFSFGKEPNLDNPQTINEKIQWLKLNDRKPIYTTLADKYAVREWLSDRFGDEYLIPLLFKTDNWRDIKPDNLPDGPFIVKSNSGSDAYFIVRDKNKVDWSKIRKACRCWLNTNSYYITQEWQYKYIKNLIIVEKLLLDENNHIPNDYKFNFFNGKLEFIYCSIDRERKNYRKIYSPEWKALPFSWCDESHNLSENSDDIEMPINFQIMKEFGETIAKDFRYVRVDFYEVRGRLYFGEITLHHGSGVLHMFPEKYDIIYGQKLEL